MANEIDVVINLEDNTSSGFKSANKAAKEYGNGIEDAGEKADKAEQRTLGLKDTVDGVATIMQGPGKQGIAAYIQGWADLAGGLANFVIPALGALTITNIRATASMVAAKVATVATTAATKAWAAAQWVLNAALRANPILLVVTIIAALAAGIIYAYKHSERFRAIVDGAGRVAVAAFRSILNAVNSVIGFMRRNWPTILAIITGPVGIAVLLVIRNFQRIKSFVAGIPGFFVNVFNRVKGAIINGVASAVATAIAILERIPSYVASIPGRVGGSLASLGSRIGNAINPFAHGGVIGAAGGGPRSGLTLVGEHGPELIQASAGSRVIPNGRTRQMLAQSGGATVINNFYINGVVGPPTALINALQKAISNKGGNVQTVLGGRA